MDMGFMFSAVFGYLLGSIPVGLLLCFAFGYGDIRKIGSGNIGATNVLRTGNKLLAFLTFLLDSGKGAIPVLLTFMFFENLNAGVVAVSAVLGHNFPVWLKFKGGKGISTTFGTIVVLSWPVGLGALCVWLLMAVIFRISSLAALTSAMVTPVFSVFLAPDYVVVFLVLALMVFVRHHENIKRLLKGEESKISFKKKDKT